MKAERDQEFRPLVAEARLGVIGNAEVYDRSATFPPCGRYCCHLTCRWALGRPVATFTLLDLWTAAAVEDDPTIRRSVGFARAGGCPAIAVGIPRTRWRSM